MWPLNREPTSAAFCFQAILRASHAATAVARTFSNERINSSSSTELNSPSGPLGVCHTWDKLVLKEKRFPLAKPRIRVSLF
jgi:hypothetical protein